MIFTVGANEKMKISSLDIKGAFIQGDNLKEVLIIPPTDIRKKKKNILWKLNKDQYRLNNAERNFYFHVIPLLEGNGYKVVGCDQAFFYKLVRNKLVPMVAIHMDNFIMMGGDEIVKLIVKIGEN